MRHRRLPLPALMLLLALHARAADDAAAAPPAPPACTIVLGQGRNVAEADGEANKLWDNVNLAFNSEVAAQLKQAGVNVVALVLRVTATDLQGNVQKLLARAAADHCVGIVETTVFADYAAATLVARIRDYPLVADTAGGGGNGPLLRIGAPRYVVERNFQLTRSTLDRVRPAALGAEMAKELIEQAPR